MKNTPLQLKKYIAWLAMVFIFSMSAMPALADTAVTDTTPGNPLQKQQADIGANDGTKVTNDNQLTYATTTPTLDPTVTPTPQVTSTPDPTFQPCDANPITDPTSTSTETSTTSQNGDASSTPSDASSTPATTQTSPCQPSGGTNIIDHSNGRTTVTSTTTVEIINTNDIKVNNQVDSLGNTGANNVNAGNDTSNVGLSTGDVNIYANVLTIANTNMVSSQLVQTSENFNNLSNSLLLNGMEKNPADLAQDLVTGMCDSASQGQVADNSSSSTDCKSFSSFKLTNKNNADVNNNVGITGQSGDNQIGAGRDALHDSITTGNVNAVVNVLNIVNNNLVNSRLTIVNFNVFGNWSGDLVMPSELYFDNSMTVGDNSAVNTEVIKKVVFDIKNSDTGNIQNNVKTAGDTGNNAIGNTGSVGDVAGAGVQTGGSKSGSDVQNIANTSVINGKWYLGLVNILGSWSGDIYSLPEHVAVAPTQTGMSFFATNANNQDGAYQAFANAMDDSSASTTDESTTEVGINNQNNATVNNNVDLTAVSGDNGIVAGNDVFDGHIKTGNTKALANIINFVNTNLVNANVQVGMVNIFGKWTGNVVFGYPDLAVNQKLVGDSLPSASSTDVHFQFGYNNSGDGSMANTTLEWHYNPQFLSLSSVTSSAIYTQTTLGVLMFQLGRVMPGTSGIADVLLKTTTDLAPATVMDTYAHIYGSGPEPVLANNESILHSQVAGDATTTTPTPTPTPTSSVTPTPTPIGSATPTPTPTTQSSGGGGGGGGYIPPSSINPTQPSTGLLISKTNNAGSSAKHAGDVVSFTISVDNHTGQALSNVIIYDSLRAPDGTIVSSKEIPVGDMKVNDGADIHYDLQITNSAPAGQYTNSAYAKGLNSSLQAVHSAETATTSFVIGGGISSQTTGTNPDGTPKSDTATSTDPSKAFKELQKDNTNATNTPQVLGVNVDGTHAPGTNIVGPDGTIYMITADKTLSAYTSAGAYLSYQFNSWSNVVKASDADMKLPKSTSFIPPRNGSLINDRGTIYIITNGIRVGFSSMKIFKALGYSLANVRSGDTSFMSAHGPINNSQISHVDGTLVNDKGTLFVMKNGARSAFPTMNVFKSWGYGTQEAVPANAFDKKASLAGVLGTRVSSQLSF